MPPAPFVGITTTVGSPALLFGFLKNVIFAWVAMFSTVPSKVCPSAFCFVITACSSLIGSFTTSCIASPSMFVGRSGSVVPNGVLGFVADAATLRSYCVNPGGGTAVSFSDDPAAFITGGAVGCVANGVLLNEGNCEKAYCAVGVVSVGSPLKAVAMPCASNEFPCGIVPILAMSCDPVGGVSGGYVTGCHNPYPRLNVQRTSRSQVADLLQIRQPE